MAANTPAISSGAGFLREERDLVGDHHLHLRRQAELLGLLHRQHRVAAPVHVDDELGAGVGDVGEILAEVLGAERRDLVGHLRPAAVLGQVVVDRLGDGVAVGVVRRHERRLLVLAEVLDQHRADRVGRGLAVEVLAEAVAHAILAGGVVRAGDAGDVEHVLALRELVGRDRDRRRGRAGEQHGLVLGDEAC